MRMKTVCPCLNDFITYFLKKSLKLKVIKYNTVVKPTGWNQTKLFTNVTPSS